MSFTFLVSQRQQAFILPETVLSSSVSTQVSLEQVTQDEVLTWETFLLWSFTLKRTDMPITAIFRGGYLPGGEFADVNFAFYGNSSTEVIDHHEEMVALTEKYLRHIGKRIKDKKDFRAQFIPQDDLFFSKLEASMESAQQWFSAGTHSRPYKNFVHWVEDQMQHPERSQEIGGGFPLNVRVEKVLNAAIREAGSGTHMNEVRFNVNAATNMLFLHILFHGEDNGRYEIQTECIPITEHERLSLYPAGHVTCTTQGASEDHVASIANEIVNLKLRTAHEWKEIALGESAGAADAIGALAGIGGQGEGSMPPPETTIEADLQEWRAK